MGNDYHDYHDYLTYLCGVWYQVSEGRAVQESEERVEQSKSDGWIAGLRQAYS